MTTATATRPLESFQQGRDTFLAAVLGAVSGLEGSVLGFEHQHEGLARAAGAELSEALHEKARLETLVGEQALELDVARQHACAAPDSEVGLEADVAEAPASAAADGTGPDEAAHLIAELRAALEAEKVISEDLRGDLEAAKSASAALRAKLDESTGRLARLGDVADKLQIATETHARYVSGTQAAFDQRVAAGVRTAETGVRVEAVRIIEAIAADNPALAEAADLFTVAFPAEAYPADGGQDPARIPGPIAEDAPETAEDFLASLPAPVLADEPAAPLEAAAGEWEALVPTLAPEEFFHHQPGAAPELLTQDVPLVASDGAIMDSAFFDTPAPAEEPSDEPAPARVPAAKQMDAPKPGFGMFGRKKEHQGV